MRRDSKWFTLPSKNFTNYTAIEGYVNAFSKI